MPTIIVRVVSVFDLIVLLLSFLSFLANYLTSVLQSEAEIFKNPTYAAIHSYCFGIFFAEWVPRLYHIVRAFSFLDESETFFLKQVDKCAVL